MRNFQNVLNVLGIHDYKEQKDEFLANCIFCGESKYNLQINLRKKLYHCWVCHEGGNLYKLLRIVTGFSEEDSNRLFQLDEIDVNKELKRISEMLNLSKDKYAYLHFLDDEDVYDHWESRGIEYETVNELRLGYDKYTNRMVIPIFDVDSVCVGLVRRAVTREQEPKYLYNKGFDRNKVVYKPRKSEHSHVIVVEGQIDAIKLYQLGYNPVCVMGTDISQYAFDYLCENFNRIFLMFDNDDAGKMATLKAAKRFYSEGVEVYEVEYSTDDPGDLVHTRQILNSRMFRLNDF